jgi:hypothetical protein
LRLGSEPAIWSVTPPTTAAKVLLNPWACLLDGFKVRAEVVRSRQQPPDKSFFHEGRMHIDRPEGDPRIFETKTRWSYLAKLPPEPKQRGRQIHR